MQIRALDKKTSSLSDAKNIVPKGVSWINTVREAIGMTAVQLAKRLGVTQPRIAKMEINEENLKLSTMKKVAQAMNCDFVYYFKPKTTFQDIVQIQAKKKAEEILLGVNLNMALENQDIQTKEAVNDMAADFINGNTKRIWD
ncbi:MAG: mobile mystery protein A [Treponema sp.]|nr:mobile mystery protein A [Treponema sp.]